MAGTGFRSVIGPSGVVTHLQRAIASDRVSQAYLIAGEAGSGKRTVAEAFALTLMCAKPEEGPDACGQCPSCRKILDHNHPDVITVTHEKPGVITVDEIRTQVVNTADILPYEGGRKIYLIPDAEKMNPQAQNALLKTIEEPPSYAVFLLLTAAQEAMLPTILSRCVKLTLLPVEDRLVSEYLERELRLPDYEARVITAFAQGNIGKAREEATDAAASERRTEVLTLLKNLYQMDAAALCDAVKSLKEEKDDLPDVFDIMLLYFRDLFLYQATGDDSRLVFRGENDTIREAAGRVFPGALYAVFDALDEARVRIRGNVNAEATLENLLFVLQDALKGDLK